RCAELVSDARENFGTDISCETCPHYLALADVDLDRLGASAKCAPPLRSDRELNDLWQELNSGKFAFVASDHSPAPQTMKAGDDAFSIWGGISGVQSTLPILLSRNPPLPLPLVATLAASGAARRVRIPGTGTVQ